MSEIRSFVNSPDPKTNRYPRAVIAATVLGDVLAVQEPERFADSYPYVNLKAWIEVPGQAPRMLSEKEYANILSVLEVVQKIQRLQE